MLLCYSYIDLLCVLSWSRLPLSSLLCPQSIHVWRQPEDSWRGYGGHRPVGHHNHGYEECPEVPVVVARLDARSPRLCALVYSFVDGETINVLLCSIPCRANIGMSGAIIHNKEVCFCFFVWRTSQTYESQELKHWLRFYYTIPANKGLTVLDLIGYYETG